MSFRVNLDKVDAVLESKRGLTLRVWVAYDPIFEVVAQVTVGGESFQGRAAYIELALQRLNDSLPAIED